jgi:hypothetical protein
MPNIYKNLPFPVGSGTGAPVDTSDMGSPKTISLSGPFDGYALIEAGDAGLNQWSPVAKLEPGVLEVTIPLLALAMRIRRVGGTAPGVGVTAAIGADAATPQFAALAVPPGDGFADTVLPANVDPFKSLFCLAAAPGDQLNGQVFVDISEDGTSFNPALEFSSINDHQNLVAVAKVIRVRRQSVVAGGPVPIIGLAMAPEIGGGGAVAIPGYLFGPDSFLRLEDGVLMPGVPALDAFGRPQLWFTGFNPAAPGGARGGIVRLGANPADGDPFAQDSEGIVINGPTYAPYPGQIGDGMSHLEPNSIRLTRASDYSKDYFHADELAFRYGQDNVPGATAWFYIDRVTGKIGIKTDAPNPYSDLDIVQSSLAYRAAGLLLSNGANDDISIGSAPRSIFYRVTGPTTPFSIAGFKGGSDGRILVVENTVAQPLTITNESAGSTPPNRITTGTGADIVLGAGGLGTVTLIYDAVASRWIVTAVNGVAAVGGLVWALNTPGTAANLATSVNGLAIGSNAMAAGFGGETVVGNGANCDGSDNVAIGSNAVIFNFGPRIDNCVVVGAGSHARGSNSVAVGQNARVDHTNGGSVAIGQGAVTTFNAVSVGQSANAAAGGVAIGQGADSSGQPSVAIGQGSLATKIGAVAVGPSAHATGQNSASYGPSADASADGAIAIGGTVTKLEGTAVGAGAAVTDKFGTAVGSGSHATYQGVAVGYNASATNSNGIALGQSAISTGGISLGYSTAPGVAAGEAKIGDPTDQPINSFEVKGATLDPIAAINGPVADTTGLSVCIKDGANPVVFRNVWLASAVETATAFPTAPAGSRALLVTP